MRDRVDSDVTNSNAPATQTNSNVSTTALWVAHMRAEETQKKKPLINDPFAKDLAGNEGKEFADSYDCATKNAIGKTFDPIVRAKYIGKCHSIPSRLH